MEEEKDILSVLDHVKRVSAPDDLYAKILGRLRDEVPSRWRYIAAAAAILLLVANLSMIAMANKSSHHDRMNTDTHNPFSITNDLHYE